MPRGTSLIICCALCDSDECRKRIFRDSLISFPRFFLLSFLFLFSLSLVLSALHATMVMTKPPRTNLIVARRVVDDLFLFFFFSFQPANLALFFSTRNILTQNRGKGEIIFVSLSLSLSFSRNKVARPTEKPVDSREGRNVNLQPGFVCSH